ncbi:hypothetical protein [Paenirhodobacter sp.]|uniref:hypothetical protein n=1 Tax=Paenirhodobacter sp. TaxID=1965326 RepID=UPI003B3C43E5
MIPNEAVHNTGAHHASTNRAGDQWPTLWHFAAVTGITVKSGEACIRPPIFTGISDGPTKIQSSHLDKLA